MLRYYGSLLYLAQFLEIKSGLFRPQPQGLGGLGGCRCRPDDWRGTDDKQKPLVSSCRVSASFLLVFSLLSCDADFHSMMPLTNPYYTSNRQVELYIDSPMIDADG